MFQIEQIVMFKIKDVFESISIGISILEAFNLEIHSFSNGNKNLQNIYS